MKLTEKFYLKNFTTMEMGGPARFFVVVTDEVELQAAIGWAEMWEISWYIVGEGSNLIAADKGYDGLIIQNGIEKFEQAGNHVIVGGGNNLLDFIKRLNRLSRSGLERMAGIPGTVGGAIYGCAGAYGQEIKDNLVRVKIFDGQKFRYLSNSECEFGYRTSIFKKHKKWVILDAEFGLEKGDRAVLQTTSKEIIKLRTIKYKAGLKCPGSFFKNIKLSDLPANTVSRFLKKVAVDKIAYGKVPAGYLLQEVGAKGMRQGSIRVANHHGNLIYNPNGGKAVDVKKLANRLRALVKNKFSITIEEEVQYLN